jgi:hypothetical protein
MPDKMPAARMPDKMLEGMREPTAGATPAAAAVV